ncbi:hypothetical protein [Streptomyces sulphureus]|uniref:hypothetical protein n=1 Tax=Streptomyces sulphureus TaxID=47758 RepID=UPI0003667828|nr:hypothetical protein [Streptomyces sulphureus]
MPSTWRTGGPLRSADGRRDGPAGDDTSADEPGGSGLLRWFWPGVFVLATVIIGVMVGREGFGVVSGALSAGVLALAGAAWRQDQLPRRQQLLTLGIALPAAVLAAFTAHLAESSQQVDVFAHTTLDGARTAVLAPNAPAPLKVGSRPTKDHLEVQVYATDTRTDIASCVDVGELEFSGPGLKQRTNTVDLNPDGVTRIVLGLAPSSEVSLDVRLVKVDAACGVELQLAGARFV